MKLLAIILTVLTTLSDGMFHTRYETEVQADLARCNSVVDTMIHYLQTEPELLSEHFFGGLGRQGDSRKNAFYLVWKDSEYDAEKQYSRLVLDVLVEDKAFLKDVVVESLVTDSMKGDKRDIRVDIHYAGSMIKEAYGNFIVQPTSDTTAIMAMEVNVKFGWFFRIFISRRVYSETIDWRLERFVQNLKLTAEGEHPDDAYWESRK